MRRLEGRTAIVTGSGQGIGDAIAMAMAEEGASVVVAELREDTAVAVRHKIEEAGGIALAHATDVSREDSVDAMVKACLDRFGKVDILVNNAGIYPTSTVEDMAEEEWERVIGTNLFGTFLCSRAVTPYMLRQRRRRGRIISITSGRGLQGADNGAHYAASKGGIIGFTKSLALELAPAGIAVNCICPGVSDTAQPRGHRTEEELYASAARIPLGRIGQPRDMAKAAVFLASDRGRFVTGQTVVVNGGAIMQ
ncbi:MAG: glucose 1-dehydrogenase [Deltaproteobacteria bacterium]|nr:glucose 1-dehydrogenase [Deltaproteobacteria bacterium]